MKHLGFLALITILSSVSDIANGNTSVTVGGQPEAVITYGNHVYASNLGESPGLELDGDGYISRLTIDGQLLEKKKFPMSGQTPLNSPTAMKVISDVLYVLDVNQVVGYSLHTYREVFRIDAPTEEISFLNDIEYIGRDSFLVSATNTKKLYRLNKLRKEWHEVPLSIAPNFLNGIVYDRHQDKVYIVENQALSLNDNNGVLHAFSLDRQFNLTHEWSLNFGRFLDGIAILGRDHLVISDWKDFTTGGELHYVRIQDQEIIKSDSNNIRGLADFSYNRQYSKFIMPALLEGKVYLSNYQPVQEATVSCEALHHEAPNTLELSIDLITNLIYSVREHGASCRLGEYSSNEMTTYYRTIRNKCSSMQRPDFRIRTIEQNHQTGNISVSAEYDRWPDDCESRACNPSPIGYKYFRCETTKH